MHHPTRREFLQSSAALAASGAMLGSLSATTQAVEANRTRANKGRIYKANKGGGIGADHAAMVAKLEQYKQLGFDGIEGGSPEIK
ncbi:MAG: twin-arginine translocation signal domain-containing protein, partial [Planctomycetaceae bacterium]|nr:twin-arginine translocation signal domain-containing protein [Planctomycetaceae bacterium]